MLILIYLVDPLSFTPITSLEFIDLYGLLDLLKLLGLVHTIDNHTYLKSIRFIIYVRCV